MQPGAVAVPGKAGRAIRAIDLYVKLPGTAGIVRKIYGAGQRVYRFIDGTPVMRGSMSYETILFEEAAERATITLNRADKLNSFNEQMHQELADALSCVENGTARSLLVTGAGRGFCAGQDLSDRSVAEGEGPVDLGWTLENYYNPLVRRIKALPLPVICAVNGVAAGAGANFAFACDLVLAARSAKFIEPFAGIGLVPDTGGTWSLPRLVGPARAAGMMLTGEKIPAETAESWGLIWKVVDDDSLAAEAQQLAQRLAGFPTAALAKTKRALQASSENSFDEQLELERDLQREAGFTEDYKEGVAAFMEKREPNFKGR